MKLTAQAMKIIQWRHLAVRVHKCPLCRVLRPMVKFDNCEMAVRCIFCRSSAVTMSLAEVLFSLVQDMDKKDVYELSSRGPLHNVLKKEANSLTFSEYFDHVGPGNFHQGVQCQDVQNLTYPDNSFDICTSTEVFEHVPDDLKGFSEILRVLKPGGLFVFTVPMHNNQQTVVRSAVQPDGNIKHFLEPQYHADPAKGHSKTLVFRDYGQDIVERLKNVGFDKAGLVQANACSPWGYGRQVIVGQKYLPQKKTTSRSNSLE